MKLLAIIPARGGSKGIKNKNIIDVNGRPLIDYSIAPLLSVLKKGMVEEAIVSTDSEIIANISLQSGIKVPFLRPGEIADDKARSIDFVIHALSYFEGEGRAFDAVIVLQPTSPLRNEADIEEAIGLFTKCQEAESLISCFREDALSEFILYKKNENNAVPISEKHNAGVRRQETDNLYVRNGAIYIVSVPYVREKGRMISDRPLMYEMPKERSVNIDALSDLENFRRMVCT